MRMAVVIKMMVTAASVSGAAFSTTSKAGQDQSLLQTMLEYLGQALRAPREDQI